MLESGFKISDLQNIPVHKEDCQFQNKIILDNTFILGYSHTIYGINYNKQNYKIPLNSLRNDIKGYIGVESLVAPWTNQLKLWHGLWNHEGDKNKSYTHIWDKGENADVYSNHDKFSDLENSYYIISDTPFPFETEDLNNRENGEKPSSELNQGLGYSNNSINTPIKKADPHPDSNKIVTKSYIDERLAGKRLIEVETDFRVRDYDCVYVIRADELQKAGFNHIISIHLPESYNARSLHNRLEFSILLEGVWSESQKAWLPATTQNVVWKIYDFNGVEITPTWLNDGLNNGVDITNNYLYVNSRYLSFRLETITSNVTSTPILGETEAGSIVIGYTENASYDVHILCENLLYRNTGIGQVNGHKGNYLNVTSPKNSVIVSTSSSNSTINLNLETDLRSTNNSVRISKPTASKKYWDLSVDIPEAEVTNIKSTDGTVVVTRPTSTVPYWDLSVDIPESKAYIQALPTTEFDLVSVRNKTLRSTANSPILKIRNYSTSDNDDSHPATDEVITFHLILTVSEDSRIYTDSGSYSILWIGTNSSLSPIFLKNRIYHITITTYPAGRLFTTTMGIGKVNWFIDPSMNHAPTTA